VAIEFVEFVAIELNDMQAKRKVLARFPNACLFEAAPDYWVVMPGDGTVRYLDIHVTGSGLCGKTAAWRSAHFWCVRNPNARAATNVNDRIREPAHLSDATRRLSGRLSEIR
jgi:hypothetical protein